MSLFSVLIVSYGNGSRPSILYTTWEGGRWPWWWGGLLGKGIRSPWLRSRVDLDSWDCVFVKKMRAFKTIFAHHGCSGRVVPSSKPSQTAFDRRNRSTASVLQTQWLEHSNITPANPDRHLRDQKKGNNPPGQEWKVILRVVSGGINDTRKRSESRRSWEKVKKGKYFTPTTDKDYCLYLEFVSDVNGR